MIPRVALAVTVRDEARLLRAHLEYHRLLGIDRAYVYLDEPGDATLGTVEDLDFVAAGPCVPAERFRAVRGLERFVSSWSSHLAARQSLNVADAMERAEAAGCEWLLSIDADELVCLDRSRIQPGALPRALAELPGSVSVVWLPNLEVVQRPRSERLVFREARLFKSRGGPARDVRDPRSGRTVCAAWFYGHAAGKSVARLRRGAVPKGSHEFAARDGASLPRAALGELLHYYAYDFEDWRRRCRSYRAHAPRHVSGQPVEPQKLLWIELVEELSAGPLEEYFARTLVLPPEALRRLRTRSWRRLFRAPAVVEVSSVAEAFESAPALRRC